jgi:peptide/nickel transport system substrate-binding protein
VRSFRTPSVVLPLTALAVGAVLVAAARPAAESGSWTFRVAVSFGATPVDPALSGDPGPPVFSAICANLYRYPAASGPRGGRLVPEVAAGPPRISRDSRTYTFTLRRGFRFNDGVRVRAANFAAAINRALDPAMASGSAALLTDVVGADSVAAGTAQTASGVRYRGDTLTVRLKAPGPDLPARLAASFFCAIPVNTEHDPNGVTPATAGPYYVSHLDPATLMLRRNPYYPGHRPRNPAEIAYQFSQSLPAIPLEIERGTVDCCTSDEAAAKRHPKLLHVAPGTTVTCLALNNERPLFKNNVRLRRAVNYAIDRRGLAAQLPGYPHARPTDQYLPSTMPGFEDAKIYRLSNPDVATARRLARGHLGSAKAIMYVRNTSATALARARIVQYDLGRIGLTVDIRAPTGDAASTRGAPFDIVDIGCVLFVGYMDPAAILGPSFDGRVIRATGNTNVAYFSDPKFNRRFAASARLSGRTRYHAYGRLDVDLARAAPAVAYGETQQAVFVASRIGCVKLNPLYGLSLGAVCWKRS